MGHYKIIILDKSQNPDGTRGDRVWIRYLLTKDISGEEPLFADRLF